MPNPNASSPVDPQVLTLFQEELARAAALPGPEVACPALWPRFAGYYQGLTRLPRRLRRALQRRWRRSLGGIALLCALGQAPALAATISVGGVCTLVDAITAANTDAPAGGCTAGTGADTITSPFVGTHRTLITANNSTYGPTGLPVINSEITISGDFLTITRDSNAPQFRILAVGATGNLTLRATTVTGGVAASDSCLFPVTDRCRGGGIINRGALTLTDSYVSGNVSRYTDFLGNDRGHGGGIENSNGTLTLTGSDVSGNTGGGIDSYGTLSLTTSSVTNNTRGGINSFGTSALTLTNSTVSGNAGSGINSSRAPLTVTNSTVSGNAGSGISNFGALTVTNSTVSGNAGGGIFNFGALTVTNSTVSGNTYGGISARGTAILTNSTVSGNSTTGRGGGIYIYGTLTLADSTIEGNFAQSHGGGIYNGRAYADYGGTRYARIVTLTNTTVSDNSAGTSGGGVSNGDTLMITNSTVSSNTATDRGGGVDSTGTATFTNSTVTGNVSGRVAGGLLNTGNVTLVQSLLSGNTAPVNGPEGYSVAGQNGQGTVIADGFNVFGHDGSPGIAGFTLGASDFVPADPLAAILDPTLSYNGGATRTHALVFGSPAVDAVFGAACATATDQRGAPRAQDGDGDTFADCDSGAVERGQVPVQATLNSTRFDCRTAACQVPVTCNLTEAGCTNDVEVTVRARPRRNTDGTAAKAPRLIRFAAGAANIPPGGTGTVTLKLTKQGKRFVRATKKKRLKAVLGIREIATTVSNAPLTISRTDVTIRLKRRK